jgi:hypothetical protein
MGVEAYLPMVPGGPGGGLWLHACEDEGWRANESSVGRLHGLPTLHAAVVVDATAPDITTTPVSASRHQPPATSHQPPATSHLPPATGHRPPATNDPLDGSEHVREHSRCGAPSGSEAAVGHPLPYTPPGPSVMFIHVQSPAAGGGVGGGLCSTRPDPSLRRQLSGVHLLPRRRPSTNGPSSGSAHRRR